MKNDSEELIYDKKVKFSYVDSSHKYRVAKRLGDKLWAEPQPVVGITTITGIIAKDALVYWSAKVAAEYMLKNWKKAKTITALAEEAKIAHKDESKKSAGVGTVGHKMIEALLLGKEVKMPEKPELKEALENIRVQHEKFVIDFSPKTIHVEKPMYSLLYDFAGTDDWLCEINGKIVLIDFKTSNRSYYNPDGVYASNFAQLGGQAILIEEMLGVAIDDAWIVNYAKDSQEYKLKSLSAMGLKTIDAKAYFLNCLNLYNINKTFEWRMSK